MKSMRDQQQFWTSSANLRWVALALTVVTLHILIHWRFPAFAPPSLGKPLWIRYGLESEFIINFIILGAGLGGITNSIPCLKKPDYSQDGLLSLNTTQNFEQIQWEQLICVVLEIAAFVAIWLWLWNAL